VAEEYKGLCAGFRQTHVSLPLCFVHFKGLFSIGILKQTATVSSCMNWISYLSSSETPNVYHVC